jgi:hypothetical protein
MGRDRLGNAGLQAVRRSAVPISLTSDALNHRPPDRSTHEIAVLRALTHRDLVEFFLTYVAAGGVGRRTFISLVDPGTEAPAPGTAAAAASDDEEEEDDDEEEEEEEAAATPAVGAALTAQQTGSSLAREDLIAPDPGAPPSEVEPASPITPVAATLLALLPRSTEVALDLTASQALHIQRAASAHGFALSRSREHALAAVLGFFEDAGVPIADRIRAAMASGNGSAIVLRCSVAVPSCDALRGALALFPTPETPLQS